MHLQEIKDYIFTYVRDAYEIGDDPDFTPEANLFDEGFLDSLGATDLTQHLEEHFGIEITQQDIVLYAMSSIDEIAQVVERKLG